MAATLDYRTISGRLHRDITSAAEQLSKGEARGLVKLYYEFQEHRIALDAQVRSSDEATQLVLNYFAQTMNTLEKQMVSVLKKFAENDPMGQWALEVHGIGPVLSAGLLAHLDVTKSETAGGFWRFAGLDPSVTWNKGEKRPWNADLKVLCWKIGKSFVMQSGNDACRYGRIYRDRKSYEVNRNETGGNAETAAAKLQSHKIRDAELRACLTSGKLPDGQLDARARRYAVKIFLSHWHSVAYEKHHGKPAPMPFAIAQLGRAHYIAP